MVSALSSSNGKAQLILLHQDRVARDYACEMVLHGLAFLKAERAVSAAHAAQGEKT